MASNLGAPLFPKFTMGRGQLLRTLATMGGTILAGGLVYWLLPMRGDWGYLGAAVAVAAQLTLVPLSISRARAIATSPFPIAAAMEAIVFLLVILVFGFATAYFVLADESAQMVGIDTKIDAVYFAISTLATVGYGDVHASGQVARVAASIQMLVDLVFIAVVVRMIAAVARRTVGDRDAPSGDDADGATES